jgi:hypothetical protein
VQGTTGQDLRRTLHNRTFGRPGGYLAEVRIGLPPLWRRHQHAANVSGMSAIHKTAPIELGFIPKRLRPLVSTILWATSPGTAFQRIGLTRRGDQGLPTGQGTVKLHGAGMH